MPLIGSFLLDLGLPGVRYLTGPSFFVQGLVDNFTQNWMLESVVFYPVFILRSLK